MGRLGRRRVDRAQRLAGEIAGFAQLDQGGIADLEPSQTAPGDDAPLVIALGAPAPRRYITTSSARPGR